MKKKHDKMTASKKKMKSKKIEEKKMSVDCGGKSKLVKKTYTRV